MASVSAVFVVAFAENKDHALDARTQANDSPQQPDDCQTPIHSGSESASTVSSGYAEQGEQAASIHSDNLNVDTEDNKALATEGQPLLIDLDCDSVTKRQVKVVSGPPDSLTNASAGHQQQQVSLHQSGLEDQIQVVTGRGRHEMLRNGQRRTNVVPQSWGYYAGSYIRPTFPPQMQHLRQRNGPRVFNNRNHGRTNFPPPPAVALDIARVTGNPVFENRKNGKSELQQRSSSSDSYSRIVRGPGFRSVSNNNQFHGQVATNGSDPATEYPLLYVAPTGTISVLLKHNIVIEMTVDKTIRVLCSGKFSAATNNRGTASCIMHPEARIFQTDTKVFAEFETGKLAVIGSQGIIFTMKHSDQAYLLSCANRPSGTVSIPSKEVFFPSMGMDFTMTLFYEQSQTGEQFVPVCEEIVRNAMYNSTQDTLCLTLNEIYIRQQENGDVELISPPRNIRMSPSKKTISVRTHFVEMAILEDQMAHIKRGVKRVHVSKCGMVVSDGNCAASMDAGGRLLS